jgi:BirA family biotin operon repressor/biotin-[acetyl-CoA-carboxylase] ligase
MTTGPADAGSPPPAAADRAPLSATALRSALVRPGAIWRDVRVVAQTGSTNTDLLAAARDGTPQGLVLAAESQTAARGRMGRRWLSPPRAALTFSVLLRPGPVPAGSKGWVPLLAGVAVASALRAEAGVDARLKWPNDVLVDGAKVAGILAEQAGQAIVVGAGINVSARQDEMPATGATSLAVAGAICTNREHLLACVLAELERWYLAWLGTAGPQPAAGPEFAGQAAVEAARGAVEAGRAVVGAEAGSAVVGAGNAAAEAGAARRDAAGTGPDPDACGLRPAYRRLSATLGEPVRVELPGGQVLTGTAQDIDESGRLVILAASGLVAVSAGDVVHLR